MQLGQLQQIENELLELGFRVFAASPERPEKLREMVENKHFSYTLLSDSPMDAARAFGLAYRVDDQAYARLKGFGVDLEESSGKKHHLLPVPAVYLIDRSGGVKFQYVNPNYKVRLRPDILLAVARSMKE